MIKTLTLKSNNGSKYPYHLPLFSEGFELDVYAPVTIIIGENGSGKSSLLKVIQSKLGLVCINANASDSNIAIDASHLTIHSEIGVIKGFYFESKTFVRYVDFVNQEILDAKKEIERIDKEYKDKSDYAKMMAKSPYHKTIGELNAMYDKDLSLQSHGESYLDFFKSRVKDNGIYLLDEPETPLSIQNQLTLFTMIMDAIKRGCQFIIATHSPILAALPEAIIYEIKANRFVKTSYENIESINLLKEFLNHKDHFIHHLKK